MPLRTVRAKASRVFVKDVVRMSQDGNAPLARGSNSACLVLPCRTALFGRPMG
jgi:hypothetical protein